MASSRFVSKALALIAALAFVVEAQETNSNTSGGTLANIPGAKTATGILASSADGMSRYLAPDGPIQPALTAIGGLPLRGIELANNGITRISQGFDNGAQSLSRSAGNDGTIRMPGMDAMESAVPASFAQLGGMMQGAIKQKNKFIMGQAEKGIQAGERLKNMMQSGLKGMSVRSAGHMAGASNMMSSAQDAMMKSTSEITNQLQKSLDGTMGRMKSMQGIGQNMRRQAQGISRTLTDGLTGTVSHLQRTGDQISSQLQSGMHQNMGALSGIVGSMQGSMGNMGNNMQKNLHGVVRHVQSTAEQVSSHLQQAASRPLEMIKGLGDNLGGMMMMHNGGGSQGKRY